MKIRKVIVVLLSAMMVFASTNLAAVGEAFAAEMQSEEVSIVESGQCGSKVNWTLDSEGTLTLSGTGETYTFTYDSTNGTVYRTVNGERVPNPFSSNDKIKKIVVEEGITKVQNYGFYDCRNLVEVELPESMVTVGRGLFRKCTALEEIELPAAVTVIGHNAFMDATALKKIVIPEGVPDLRDELFRNCTSLEEVILPEGLTTIGNHVFRNCTSLKAIDIPEGLTTLGQCAFGVCKSLEEIKVPAGITVLKQDTFWQCESLKKIELPENLTEIGAYAFQECKILETIHIPESVTTLGKQAFQQCESLVSIEIPDGVTELKDQTFYKCKSLTDIYLPNSVTILEDYVFAECDALETIKLPEGLEELGNHVFYEDNVLREIEIPAGITEVGKYSFSKCPKLENVKIPSSVTTIANYAFWQCIGLKEIVIPEGVTFIGERAFQECRYLEKITLPSTLQEIEGFAFFNCHKLKEIDLPDGLTKLGQYALYGLTDITEVTIPKGVTVIEQLTLYGCKNLEHVLFLGDVTSIGASAFSDCDQLRVINLPQSLSSVEESAFEGCDALISITMPKNVKKIARYTFRGCTSLKNVTLAEETVEIGAYAFYGCSQLQSLTVPATVRTLGTNALPVDTKLYCYKGSATETFAKEKGRKYAYAGETAAVDNLITGSVSTADIKAEWSIDRDSEKMVITGNGKMPTYTVSTQPWKDARDYITTVEIYGNVEQLGAYTFSKCENLKTLTIYNRNCDLSVLELKKDVKLSGFKGSTAEAYAKENGNTFVAIDNSHSHTYGEGVETKASTCLVAGEITFVCHVCQHKKVEPQPLLQHQYVTQFEPATMSADGMFKESCTLCGDVKEFRTIPKVKEISLSKTKVIYNGKVQKPEVVVRDGNGNLLTENEDYTIQWTTGCKNVGRHKAVVTLGGSKGNYIGSMELDYTIVPKKTSSVKAALYGYDDVKFSWSKVTGASGYLVYYKKGTGSWSKAVATTSTSYKKASLSDGVKYTFKVVPYYKESGKTTKYYDSNQYKSTTIYTLKQVTGLKVAKSGTKVKVSWTNINGETGYQISKMTKKSATQKTPTTVKSSTAKSKLLTATKGKTYYYKVRTYKTVDGKKIYGPWSTVKSYKRK